MEKVSALIRKEILELPNVKQGVSRYGSRPAFLVSGREFAHFHNEEELDIRLPFEEHKISNTSSNPYSSKWLYFKVRNEEDARIALRLIKLAYRKAVNEKKYHYG